MLPEHLMHFYGCKTEVDRTDKFNRIVKREDLNRMATIQHLYDRYNPKRYLTPLSSERMYSRFELWCHKCNQEDGNRRTKETVDEKSRKKSTTS